MLIRDLDLVFESEYEAQLAAVSRLRRELDKEDSVRAASAQIEFRNNYNRYPAFRFAFALRLESEFGESSGSRVYFQGKLFD